jgi:hypothetical protein
MTVISVTIISEIIIEGENLYTSPQPLHILPLARGGYGGVMMKETKREVFHL